MRTPIDLHALAAAPPVCLPVGDRVLDLRDGYGVLAVTLDLMRAEIRVLIAGQATSFTLTLSGVTDVFTFGNDLADPSVDVDHVCLLSRPDQIGAVHIEGAGQRRDGWWVTLATDGGLAFEARLTSLDLDDEQAWRGASAGHVTFHPARWAHDRSTGRWVVRAEDLAVAAPDLRLHAVDLDLVSQTARLLLDDGEQRYVLVEQLSGLRLGPRDAFENVATIPAPGSGDPLRVLAPQVPTRWLRDVWWTEVETVGGLGFGFIGVHLRLGVLTADDTSGSGAA